MERDEQQITGWRSFRFGFGAGTQQETGKLDAIEIAKRGDRCCSQEQCGCGCYVSAVDVDRLDQQ